LKGISADVRPLVIVPTYNERDNLPTVLRELLAIEALRILVVDDQSPDGTAQLADATANEHPGRVHVLHRTGSRGLGRSYIDGMRHALAGDADVICQMDADLSHLPSELPRLLTATADADVVIGSRYVRGGRIENWARRRRWLSAFANHYVRAITGLEPHDVTSGFRAWRREALTKIPLGDLDVEGYAFQVEMTWHAWRTGSRVVEVPITFVERRQGNSKLSRRVIVESAIRPWQLVLARKPRKM
jgi:dolichol-phosphate mannosyltransferase